MQKTLNKKYSSQQSSQDTHEIFVLGNESSWFTVYELVLSSNDISYLTYLYSLTEENKILHVNFQHIKMSYKLWVHSPQGIYYIVSPKLYNNSCHQYKVSQDIITHESILYANNLNCIQCTQ